MRWSDRLAVLVPFLPLNSTLNPQRRAAPPAVAHLVLVRSMRRIVLILCISWTVAQLSNAQRTVTSSPAFRLAHPERANPEKDCQRAIARHDFRFVGVAGFSLDVPGVPDYQARY